MVKPTPYLLTPGPLTTSRRTKEAMLVDWGSWDEDFNTMTAHLCKHLLTMINGEDDFVCVPMQGSGSFAVEAALGSLLPRSGGKTLVISNGAYGQRIAKIITYLGRPFCLLDKGDFLPPLPHEVDLLLSSDPDITDVVMVHCETSSGILNPLEEISAVVLGKHAKRFFVDAMSSFGALPLNAQATAFDVVISSANKCIEGVPGFGFVLVRRRLLETCRGRSHSLSLDLYDQWQGFSQSGKWRFTPPTHVVAAFAAALAQHHEEGGQAGRLTRYQANHRALLAGMQRLGFETLIPEAWLSPIITTFLSPADPHFTFTQFYQQMKQRNFIIYPGKLTEVESFRLGTIGQIDTTVIGELIDAVRSSLREMGVTSASPLPCPQRLEVPRRDGITVPARGVSW